MYVVSMVSYGGGKAAARDSLSNIFGWTATIMDLDGMLLGRVPLLKVEDISVAHNFMKNLEKYGMRCVCVENTEVGCEQVQDTQR